MFKATFKNPSGELSLMLTYESFLHRSLTWLRHLKKKKFSLWNGAVSSNLSLFLCLANKMTVPEIWKYPNIFQMDIITCIKPVSIYPDECKQSSDNFFH